MVPARFIIGQRHNQEDEVSSKASWNTPRSSFKTTLSYTSRMVFAFVMTSVMTVLLLIIIVSVVWNGIFEDYARENVETSAELIASRLATEYDEVGGWTFEFLDSVSSNSIFSEDFAVQVVNTEGQVLFDNAWEVPAASADVSVTDESYSVNSAAQHAELTPTERPESKTAFISAPITTEDGTVLGSVNAWVRGSEAIFTKADIMFRTNTYDAMTLAAGIAMVIATCIGLILARSFARPIKRITNTAKQIRDGDLTARTGMRGDDEISSLAETFDEMTASLEKDLKHERRLTSDVAHELRTPLMAMLATVEAMQDGIYPTDYEHLETVASETRRLSRLVQQMLDLSRLENHTAPLKVEPVEMTSFVREIVSVQDRLFTEHDLRLRFNDETAGKDVEIECDPDMITQCIINLMSNAMRYTPSGGWVVVSVRCDRRYVMISVSDTGIGIAKEDMSRVFGRFWRSDASRSREAGGLGVGLAVTKHIVERHHGFISVESELNHGTTFTIHLPYEYSTMEN